jgi:hypothetical protein
VEVAATKGMNPEIGSGDQDIDLISQDSQHDYAHDLFLYIDSQAEICYIFNNTCELLNYLPDMISNRSRELSLYELFFS